MATYLTTAKSRFPMAARILEKIDRQPCLPKDTELVAGADDGKLINLKLINYM